MEIHKIKFICIFFTRDYSKEKYKEKCLVLEPQECNSSMREEIPQINPSWLQKCIFT